eukprot:sb/3477547/
MVTNHILPPQDQVHVVRQGVLGTYIDNSVTKLKRPKCQGELSCFGKSFYLEPLIPPAKSHKHTLQSPTPHTLSVHGDRHEMCHSVCYHGTMIVVQRVFRPHSILILQ